MRLSVLALGSLGALAMPLGCTQGASDSSDSVRGDSSVDDSADDSAVDDSGQPNPEQCGSGEDEDGDGLIDCLDPDCSEQCLEDCENGVDDDADGAVDCLDSECSALPICLGAYSMRAELRFDSLELRYGPGVSERYSHQGMAQGTGTVHIYGSANTEDDSDFECEGNLVLQMAEEGGPFPTFSWQEGACPSCTYGLMMELSPIWAGGCPVTTLPPQSVAIKDGKAGLFLEQAGSWSYHYKGQGSWSDEGKDRVVYATDVAPLSGLEWQGDY